VVRRRKSSPGVAFVLVLVEREVENKRRRDERRKEERDSAERGEKRRAQEVER
jgi:hypothetical protein